MGPGEFLNVNFFTALFTLVNTIVLFLVLKKFLWGPVMKMIADRQQEIDDLYAQNARLQAQLDTVEEKLDMVRRAVAKYPNVEVDFSGELLAEYARKKGSCVIVKGLRAGSDFENEFQMALINHKINPDLDTMFLTSEHQYMYLSSSAVKELGNYNVDLDDFLPEQIVPVFKQRIAEIRQGGNKK